MKWSDAGIYTISDAARLIGAPERRIRGWVAGYPATKADPIVTNDLGWVDGQLAFSFANLMEVRFIHHFAGRGVKVASIRMMAQEARASLDHPHPFATKAIFTTDGKKIFAVVAEKAGDKKLYDLKARNWAIYKVVVQSLHRGVIYNPAGDAEAWFPRRRIAPNVIVHPKMAFGQPVLRQYGVPTEALYDNFLAEGGSYETVAAWFEVPIDSVKEAVRFQRRIMSAA